MKVEIRPFQERQPRITSDTESFRQAWWIINISLNSFSLSCSSKDFGEYQESYYSVQTTEGEQISQLIAGYIDIILKKASGVMSLYATDAACVACWNRLCLVRLQKQSKDRFGLEGDEESTMLEESVSPKKWVELVHHLMIILIQPTYSSHYLWL